MKKVTILLILLLGYIVSAFALDKSLYQINYPVPSQSQSDWQQAVPKALAQLLVNISGSDRVLKSAQIQQQLAQASALVQSYSYTTGNDSNGQPTTLLQIQFDPQQVTQLLQQAGANATPQPRPLTLVLLAVQSNDVKRILNANSENPVLTTVQTEANSRHLPIILPIMDIEDMQNVSVDNIWQLEPNDFAAAAKRYGANVMLVGKIFPTTKDQKQWQGQAIIVAPNQSNIPVNVQGNNVNDVTTKLIDKAADTMVIVTKDRPSSNTAAQQITIRITDVSGLDDFAQVLKYLRTLAPVTDAQVVNIENDAVEVTMTVNGGVAALNSAVNNSASLQAIESDPNTQMPTYRWLLTQTPAAPVTTPTASSTPTTAPAAAQVTTTTPTQPMQATPGP